MGGSAQLDLWESSFKREVNTFLEFYTRKSSQDDLSLYVIKHGSKRISTCEGFPVKQTQNE